MTENTPRTFEFSGLEMRVMMFMNEPFIMRSDKPEAHSSRTG